MNAEGHERHRRRRREGRGDHARAQACDAGDVAAALVTPAPPDVPGHLEHGRSIVRGGVVVAKAR
jgi:hypothetical protein